MVGLFFRPMQDNEASIPYKSEDGRLCPVVNTPTDLRRGFHPTTLH